jgi:hypothetical protein
VPGCCIASHLSRAVSDVGNPAGKKWGGPPISGHSCEPSVASVRTGPRRQERVRRHVPRGDQLANFLTTRARIVFAWCRCDAAARLPAHRRVRWLRCLRHRIRKVAVGLAARDDARAFALRASGPVLDDDIRIQHHCAARSTRHSAQRGRARPSDGDDGDGGSPAHPGQRPRNARTNADDSRTINGRDSRGPSPRSVHTARRSARLKSAWAQGASVLIHVGRLLRCDSGTAAVCTAYRLPGGSRCDLAPDSVTLRVGSTTGCSSTRPVNSSSNSTI